MPKLRVPDEMRAEELRLFFYWMNERHKIYLARRAGKPWPWTKDEILQQYKFTNVYRNLDRVTKDLHVMCDFDAYSTPRYREDLDGLLFRVVAFRMFNHPDTFDLLGDLVHKWSEARAKKVLHKAAAQGKQVFTGAYIITNNGSTRPKIDLVCESLTTFWKKRRVLIDTLMDDLNSLQEAHRVMQQFPMVGKFIAYELVTDLRWTPILSHATDTHEWANPGPGAKRGLNRIHGRPLKTSFPDDLFIKEMQTLLRISPSRLRKYMEPLEMRDVEHSLCEFDKYMRVRNGEGRPRAKFTPPHKRSK